MVNVDLVHLVLSDHLCLKILKFYLFIKCLDLYKGRDIRSGNLVNGVSSMLFCIALPGAWDIGTPPFLSLSSFFPFFFFLQY